MNNLMIFKLLRFRKLVVYLFCSIIISLVFVVTSCVKDGDFEFDKMAKNQFDPTIAAPFVNSRLMLKDILKDTSGIIVEDIANNTLKLVYNKDSMVSIMAKDLFIIPNQSIQTDTSNLILTSSGSDTNYYAITKPYTFQLPKPGQRLDYVYIKKAFLVLKLFTDINHSGRIKLSIPEITYPNGQPFSVELLINYTGQATPYQIPFTKKDLSGCKIIFNNSPGHTNEITFKYEHWVYKETSPPVYPYNNPYFIQLNDSLEDIAYDKLVGYIGPYDYTIQDTLKMPQDHTTDLLEYIEFYKIGLSATIKNSYGLPIDVHVDTILAKSPKGNVLVKNFPSTNPVHINYPTLSQIGQSVNTLIPYQENADLVTAINKKPTEIIFKVTGKLNPASNPAISNFVVDTSRFTVGVNVELPLEGKIKGFVLEDTLNFDLANKLKDLQEVTFKINTSNAFPLDANVQVYFANQFGQIVDSMITTGQNVINSGVVDATTHLVTSPTTKLTEVTLSNARIRKIESWITTKLIVKAKLTSYNNGASDVKISTTDYIDVKLGMRAKVNVKP